MQPFTVDVIELGQLCILVFYYIASTITKKRALNNVLFGCFIYFAGKTLLAKTLARFVNVPFVIADATTLTQASVYFYISGKKKKCIMSKHTSNIIL